jgi:hypothetical protein
MVLKAAASVTLGDELALFESVFLRCCLNDFYRLE